MIKKVKEIFATSTLRQSGVTFGGTILNGALGAVFYIICARALGPASFGLMSISLSVAMLASSVGDLGVETGLVRFVSYYLKKDRTKANRFLKLSFKAKMLAGFSITILGVLCANFVSNVVFQKPEITASLRVAFLAVCVTLLFGFVVSSLKAFQKFFLWSAVQVGSNLFRVLVIILLFLTGSINVQNSIWAYVLTLLVGFVFGFIFLIPKDFLSVKNDSEVGRELFHYNKWIASFTIVAAVSSKLDTFISARMLSPTEIGLYAAANQLVYIVPQIVGALGTVFAPKMAEMNIKKVKSYLKKTQLMVLGIAVLGLLAAPVVALFVPIIFGTAYTGVIPPFLLLLCAMLVFLISVPVHNIIIYHYSYPKLFFYLAIGHLLIISVVGWYMISHFRLTGAAFTVLVGSTFNFVVPAVWVYRKIHS